MGNLPWTRIDLLWQHPSSNPILVQCPFGVLDLDDAIMDNERYTRQLRRNPHPINAQPLLITLAEFLRGVFAVMTTQPSGDTVLLSRPTPPQGGLELLDKLRAEKIQLHGTVHAFKKAFHRSTKSILHGLDWANLVVAGGVVLTTLLHVDPAHDEDPEFVRSDIDIYLYGLSAAQANAKVEHIYTIWKRNLPNPESSMIIKSSKSIELVAEYPCRRLQIILKLQPEPIDVLLKFDLDTCVVWH